MAGNVTGASGNRLPTNITAEETIRNGGQINNERLTAEAEQNSTTAIEATLLANRLNTKYAVWRTLSQIRSA